LRAPGIGFSPIIIQRDVQFTLPIQVRTGQERAVKSGKKADSLVFIVDDDTSMREASAA
jgi:hypothetical protein